VARRKICWKCPSRVTAPLILGMGTSDWCGPPPGHDRPANPPTCACLLKGKTSVASEACPQLQWPSVNARPPSDLAT
jgi:hypothetical protein